MERNRINQSETGHHVFKRKKLKPSKTGFRSGVSAAGSYFIKSTGLHLKAFFLWILAKPLSDDERPRLRRRALDPLSETGGTPIRLLFSIVVALSVLPLFFNFNTALAGKKSNVAPSATTNPHATATNVELKKTASVNITPLNQVRPIKYARRTQRRAPMATPPDFTRGSTALKEVSFTFDGGSYRGQTKQILDILRRRSIQTTLFLTGTFIERNPALVRRMLKDGHEIGNHMMTHSHMTSFAGNGRHKTLPGVNRAFVQGELLRTAGIFYRVTGEKMTPLWRAPYGELNKEIRGWAYNAGFVHVGWTTNYSARESLDSLDWVSDPNSRLYRTTAHLKERILRFGKGRHELNGAITLMHLGTRRRGEKLADRLDEMINTLQSRGYRFVKASTLIKGRKDMAAYLPGVDHVAMLDEELRPQAK
jgi:peptidoglycan/xylan/chitin deacetylase (PgdA/CDA1 family)